MAYTKHKHTNVYYETKGKDGPWITLIPGHMRQPSDFRSLIAQLNKHGYRALCVSNRGAGQTLTEQDFSLEDIAGDITHVWSELGIEKTSLIGTSMGGLIGQILADRDQNMIHKLVLVSTCPLGSSVLKQTFTNWPDSKEKIHDRLTSYVSKSFYKNNKLLIEAMSKQIFKQIESGNFLKNAYAQKKAVQNSDLQAVELEKIQIPTLIIHGEEDSIIPVSEAERIQEKIANSIFKPIENCGHLLLAESPITLQKIIVDFMQNPDKPCF